MQQVRRELWGYASDEALTKRRSDREKYQGIRPAPGYPSQPDHTEKQTLFDLLGATEKTGIELTSSFAMNPPASPSPACTCRIPKRSISPSAGSRKTRSKTTPARKGWDLATAERWLRPILNY
jgi:5-methyltetrahydrofolate--homocysteine methyltransferase